MIYGQFQYYNDELTSWSRTITFHKGELQEAVRQINVLMNRQVISAADEKESGSLTDQFVVQEQQFDYIAHQITSQKQRLDHMVFYQDKPLEASVSNAQDALRLKVKNAERNFARTKYTCSLYLSSILHDRSLAFQN